MLPEGFPREPAGINSVTKKKTQYIDFIWKSYRFYKYLLISSIEDGHKQPATFLDATGVEIPPSGIKSVTKKQYRIKPEHQNCYQTK